MPDPTKNVSFNLNLTPEQQQSRAQVPLPYAHDGAFISRLLILLRVPLNPAWSTGVSQTNMGTPSAIPEGSILYDPDSADDIDDDDPDEDLDI